MKKAIVILTMASLMACNNQTESNATKNEKVGLVEVTSFKLKSGVSNNDFVKSAEKMHTEFLIKEAGFISRILNVGADSVWTDIVLWKDEASQTSAMKKSEKAETAIPFMEKIDFNSVKMVLTKPQLSNQ